MRRRRTLPSSHRPTALSVGLHYLAIARRADGGALPTVFTRGGLTSPLRVACQPDGGGLPWGCLAHHSTARPHIPSGGAHPRTLPLRSRLFGPGGHFRRWMADCQVREGFI